MVAASALVEFRPIGPSSRYFTPPISLLFAPPSVKASE